MELSKIPTDYDAVIVQEDTSQRCFITVRRASERLSPMDVRQAFAIMSRIQPLRANNLVTFTVQGNLSHVSLALRKYLEDGKPVRGSIL
jgi:CO dehydrogenase nickel-insertion accessory protein CooC1